jgi:hypothetical protein
MREENIKLIIIQRMREENLSKKKLMEKTDEKNEFNETI